MYGLAKTPTIQNARFCLLTESQLKKKNCGKFVRNAVDFRKFKLNFEYANRIFEMNCIKNA